MTRAKIGTAGLGIVLGLWITGCPEPPPPPPKVVEPPPKPSATVTETATATAEPEPVGDGSKEAPFRLKIGEARALSVEVPLKPYSGFVVEEAADVVIAWSGGEIGVVRPDGVAHACGRSPCLVPVALRGFYRVTSREGADGAGGKVAVSVSALALPKPVAVKPGRGVTLKLKAVAEGDPRGEIADAALHYDAPAHQTIDVRPLGGKRGASFEELSRRVAIEVHGPGEQPVTVMSASPDVGGALRVSFDAAAGDYVIRARKLKDDASDALEVTVRKPESPVNAAKGAPPAAPAKAASLPKIKAGSKADFEVVSAPKAKPVWIDVPASADLAITWKNTSPGIAMGLQRPNSSYLVDEPPWFLFRPAPGVAELSAFPGEEAMTLTAEARALALPAAAATITPGGTVEVTTAPVGADDPRGPLSEVALDVDAAGTFWINAAVVDFKAPADLGEAARLAPSLSVFDANGKSAASDGDVMLSTEAIRAGTSTTSINAGGAGRYVVRLDGRAKAPARKIKVSLQRPSSKSSD